MRKWNYFEMFHYVLCVLFLVSFKIKVWLKFAMLKSWLPFISKTMFQDIERSWTRWSETFIVSRWNFFFPERSTNYSLVYRQWKWVSNTVDVGHDHNFLQFIWSIFIWPVRWLRKVVEGKITYLFIHRNSVDWFIPLEARFIGWGNV